MDYSKEVEAMTAAAKLRNDEIKMMQAYLDKLKSQRDSSYDEAVLNARESLKRIGVLKEDGTVNEKIVSWE